MPTQVSLSPQSGDGVFLLIGQSDAGFYGNTALTTAAANAYFFDMGGTFYTCADPVPGWTIPPGSGTGGSIWSRLATSYAAGATKPWGRLIFVLAPVYGSRSLSWTPGQANYNPKALGSYSAMVGRGWTPTAYLWSNGASDAIDMAAGTTAAGAHLTNVQAMVTGIRSAGITTPILGARTAICRLDPATGAGLGADYDSAGAALRLARMTAEAQINSEQTWLAGNLSGQQFYAGADTDRIGGSHRWDNCHLDDFGQWVAAELWLAKLLQYKAAGII